MSADEPTCASSSPLLPCPPSLPSPRPKYQPKVSSLPLARTRCTLRQMEGAERSKCSDKLGWGKIGGEDCWSPTRRANRGGKLGQCVLCCDSQQQEQAVHLLWRSLAYSPTAAASLCDAAARRVCLNLPAFTHSPFNPDVSRLTAASSATGEPSAAVARLIEAANRDVTNHNITSGNKIVLNV